jgi:hypothetical protein
MESTGKAVALTVLIMSCVAAETKISQEILAGDLLSTSPTPHPLDGSQRLPLISHTGDDIFEHPATKPNAVVDQSTENFFVTTYSPAEHDKLGDIVKSLQSLLQTLTDNLSEAWLCQHRGEAQVYIKTIAGYPLMQERPIHYAVFKQPCEASCKAESDVGSCSEQRCKGCFFCPGDHDKYSDAMSMRQVMLQDQLERFTDQINERSIDRFPGSLIDDADCEMQMRQIHTQDDIGLNIYTEDVDAEEDVVYTTNFLPTHDGKQEIFSCWWC